MSIKMAFQQRSMTIVNILAILRRVKDMERELLLGKMALNMWVVGLVEKEQEKENKYGGIDLRAWRNLCRRLGKKTNALEKEYIIILV